MLWKSIITWLPGIPIAIINGSFRDFIYRDYLGDLHANQLSVSTFRILYGIYVWFIVPWFKFIKKSQSLFVGLNWLIYTIIFEFIFSSVSESQIEKVRTYIKDQEKHHKEVSTDLEFKNVFK